MNERIERTLSQINPVDKDKLAQIQIIECNEPLVDIKRVASRVIIRMRDVRLQFNGNQVLYARETVCKMLDIVTKKLGPNFTLVVFDAYRPIAYQKMRFKQTYESYRSMFSELSENEIVEMVDQVVALPDENPDKPPAHSTGGAVDVGLIFPDGKLVDMGSEYGIYDQTQSQRHHTNSQLITSKQRENRIALISAMVETGFCNYPFEWWHFMYGDREYAAYEGLKTAIYGRADLLSETNLHS